MDVTIRTPAMMEAEKASWQNMLREKAAAAAASDDGSVAVTPEVVSEVEPVTEEKKNEWLSKVDAPEPSEFKKAAEKAAEVAKAAAEVAAKAKEEDSDASRLQRQYGTPAAVVFGEAVRVEVDVRESDDDEEAMVWASGTVCRIDETTGDFYVSVNEWASLDTNDPEYEAAYEDGPFNTAQENEYVPGA